MTLMKLNKIKKSFGDHLLLKEINLNIEETSKIGLVGINGAGKTTLAKIITGDESYDSGSIDAFYNVRVSYLKQSTEFNDSYFQDLILDKNKDINDILKTSSFLGLKDLKFWTNERMDHLSGGEKTKLSLTDVFNSKCDLLILDEPTNHLDFIGIEWLIKEIKEYDKALIVISHDRYFLDQITEKIVELEDGMLKEYSGNYTEYRKTKEANYQSALHQYENKKRKETEIKKEIDRLKRWSAVAHRDSSKKEGFKEYWRAKAKKKDQQVKSKVKRLEKLMDENNTKPKKVGPISFSFQANTKMGKSILLAEDLEKRFGDNLLFSKSNFYIKRGEKVGLIGVNGCGKTTLIKMILGEDSAFDGKLYVTPNKEIAYLSQDVFDLDERLSLDEMIYGYDKEFQTKIRTYLASNQIPPRIIYQKINTLSLGERTRIKLIFLVLQEYNILILDEPTNHLDLDSREQLEKTLETYMGTLMIASHDRYLLEKITDTVLVFEDKSISRYEYGYKEMMMRKEETQKKDIDYQLMIIQNEITYVLSEFNRYEKTNPKYLELDQRFRDLIKKRNMLEEERDKKR